MTTSQLDAIERNIKQAKASVDAGNALKRLKLSKDFKQVILEGFFEQEAVRLVHLKADSNMQSPESQRAIVSNMDAIGSFSQYLNTVLYKADMASKSIEADEESRDEIMAEEADVGVA